MSDTSLRLALILAEGELEKAEEALSNARLNLANYHIDAGTVGDWHTIEINTRYGRTPRGCYCFFGSWHTEAELPWVDSDGKRVTA